MNIKTTGKKLITIMLALVLILSAFVPSIGQQTTKSYAAKAKILKAGDKAVTIVKTNLVASPNNKSKSILTLAKGTSITIAKVNGNWYKSTLSNGKTGYIFNKNVAIAPKANKASKPATITPPKESTSTTTKSSNTTNPDISKMNIEKTMILATTTSTKDTGLLDYLIPIFEKKYNTSVKVISVGSGEAIEMGKRGDADVLLVHSRKAEDEFVSSGYGINRKDVMYNEFFIVGPKDDPAKVFGQTDAQTAMKKISEAKATFISRGDKSGTNTKELSLWSKYDVKPQGQNWYMESGQGMGDTLTMAAEKGAYTLVDSGTWFAFEDKVNLKVVVQGDKDLFNPYGVIAVNPEKYPNLHKNAANAFIEFITSSEGQKLIAGYKKNGKQLFTPDAKK